MRSSWSLAPTWPMLYQISAKEESSANCRACRCGCACVDVQIGAQPQTAWGHRETSPHLIQAAQAHVVLAGVEAAQAQIGPQLRVGHSHLEQGAEGGSE